MNDAGYSDRTGRADRVGSKARFFESVFSRSVDMTTTNKTHVKYVETFLSAPSPRQLSFPIPSNLIIPRKLVTSGNARVNLTRPTRVGSYFHWLVRFRTVVASA